MSYQLTANNQGGICDVTHVSAPAQKRLTDWPKGTGTTDCWAMVSYETGIVNGKGKRVKLFTILT